jgi:ABC-type amino acid transport substrate-binding protein
MRKIIFLFVIYLAFLPIASRADEPVFDRVMASKTINCGYFLWPPYLAKDANTGKLSGINYDIMNAIGKNLGFKVNWTAEIGVGDAVAALDAKKIDVVCASLWPSPARAQNLTLSNPTFYSIAYAFVRGDDKRFDGDLNKANDKSVKAAAIDGDYTNDLVPEKLPNATIDSLPQSASGSEMLLQVVTKKADIVFSDEGLVNDFMKTHPGALRKVAGIGPVRIYGETLATKRGEYQLKNMIDISITQLTNDGVIQGLVDKYKKDYQANFFAPQKSFVTK